MKSTLILLMIFSAISISYADNIWYFSPGLRIGWNVSGGFSVDGKISIGRGIDYSDRFVFYNLTLGFNALHSKSEKNRLNEYNYIQFQAGSNFREGNILLTGAGLGFIFNTNTGNDFSPTLRLFSGFLIFPELDFILLNSGELHSGFGIRGVLPIPLEDPDIGFD